MKDTPATPAPGAQEHRWSKWLLLWAAVLTLANVLADVAIGSPMMVLPQLLAHFDTDQAAWLNASAMLAGAIWSPLLAKSSDIFGQRRVLVATLLLACAGALVCLAAPTCGSSWRGASSKAPPSPPSSSRWPSSARSAPRVWRWPWSGS
ncbi:hypothetical protein HFP72_31740 [Nocardiopsis sp. ARC36]